jgi:hypothetical protein
LPNGTLLPAWWVLQRQSSNRVDSPVMVPPQWLVASVALTLLHAMIVDIDVSTIT